MQSLLADLLDDSRALPSRARRRRIEYPAWRAGSVPWPTQATMRIRPDGSFRGNAVVTRVGRGTHVTLSGVRRG